MKTLKLFFSTRSVLNSYVITSVLALVTLANCTKQKDGPYSDSFDRKTTDRSLYRDTSAEAGRKPAYDVVDGSLIVQDAYNHPLWLRQRIPDNATISFDITALEDGGDLKFEAWGDGRSFALNKGAYSASGYVFIFGGWKNSISAIVRMNEHGNDRKTRQDMSVITGTTYHFMIRREQGRIRWWIDKKLFLEFEDPKPLVGKRHRYFAFNNWSTKTRIDNLTIEEAVGKISPK